MGKTCYHQTESYLLVKASGERNEFSGIVEGTFQLSKAALEANATHILADCRDVHFNVPLADAFNLVRVYEHRFTHFQNYVVATVVNARDLELAKFWESVCRKRGFRTSVFLSIEEAERWLLKQAVGIGNR